MQDAQLSCFSDTERFATTNGTPATATTHFNDGIGPDPHPSPGGTRPFTATDTCAHTYSLAGTYAITLRVSDDDGGATEYPLTIAVI